MSWTAILLFSTSEILSETVLCVDDAPTRIPLPPSPSTRMPSIRRAPHSAADFVAPYTRIYVLYGYVGAVPADVVAGERLDEVSHGGFSAESPLKPFGGRS